MKDEAIARAKETVADWEYMKNLPEKMRDFHLQRLLTQDEDIYNISSYT